jgi:hypothetical protein
MKQISWAKKILGVTLAALILFASLITGEAKAEIKNLQGKQCIVVVGGKFDVAVTVPTNPTYITKVIATFIPLNTAYISKISISDSSGQLLFGCEWITVSEGNDILRKCGTRSFYLPPGAATYKAKGQLAEVSATSFCVDIATSPATRQ